MINKEANNLEVNPTLKFLLSNNTVVNIILLIATIGVVNLSIIASIKEWFDKEIIINLIFTIFGSFLGASLLKYGKK